MRRYLTISCLFELVIVLGIFALASRNIGDPDFWWHLRTGQHIVQAHSIPHADIYSHTKMGSHWIAHEWLSEVVIYGVYRAAGWIGLIATFAAIITAAFWMLLRRSEGRPYIAGLATLWGAVATIPFWGVRPQMFSLLLASLFLYLLDRFWATRRARLLWWMAPLMALWVNLHGGYALGLALIGVALVSEILAPVIHPASRNESLASARLFGIVLIASVVAAMANPNTYRIFLYPLETLASPSQQGFIQEWASPDFHLLRMQAFAALLIGSFLVLAISGKRPQTRDLLLLALIAYAALRSSRHIPIFALVAVPIISRSLHAWLKDRGLLPARASDPTSMPARKVLIHAVMAAVLVSACAVRLFRVANAQPAFEAREFPVSAIDYISQRHPPGPIFNSYEWGGYLIWRLYPEYRVFVDGRADVYGDAFLEEFVRTYRAENDWRSVLLRFHVNTVVMPPSAPLAVLLQEEPSWRTAFEDQQSAVFVRREPRSTPENTVSVAHQ